MGSDGSARVRKSRADGSPEKAGNIATGNAVQKSEDKRLG
jgi:hypothetical protein